jgi:hypothetical protein
MKGMNFSLENTTLDQCRSHAEYLIDHGYSNEKIEVLVTKLYKKIAIVNRGKIRSSVAKKKLQNIEVWEQLELDI